MKRLSLFLTILVLSACDNQKIETTAEDYEIVKAEVFKSVPTGPNSSRNINPMIKSGPRGDMVIPVEATPELKAIYQKKKTAKFLSIDMIELQRINPERNPYVKSGQEYCFANILIKHDTKCDLRLVCGNFDNMNFNELYAVELCKE
jgi:hypothetical protein